MPLHPVSLIIDSSYFNFYRFFATLSWYKRGPGSVSVPLVPWIENNVFMRTFQKMWFQTLASLTNKFQPDNLIFALDSHPTWRHKLYPDYKITRSGPESTDITSPAPVFRLIKETYHPLVKPPLFGVDATIVKCPWAEADDIISVATDYIKTINPDSRVIIITGDHDLLQVRGAEIYCLKGMERIDVAEPRVALMKKVLGGDPSDNIPQAFKGCGKQTVKKILALPVKEQTEFIKEMIRKQGAEQYDLNRTLIDFSFLPSKLVMKIEGILDTKKLY